GPPLSWNQLASVERETEEPAGCRTFARRSGLRQMSSAPLLLPPRLRTNLFSSGGVAQTALALERAVLEDAQAQLRPVAVDLLHVELAHVVEDRAGHNLARHQDGKARRIGNDEVR